MTDQQSKYSGLDKGSGIMDSGEWHLDVYDNRSVLHRGDKIDVFYEGLQTDSAKKRYKNIQIKLEDGFLDDVYDSVCLPTYSSELPDNQKKVIDNLLDGVTSEVGRALLGISFLQLTIKCIEPTQSIRLHKAGNSKKSFSWKEGVSMRTLDSTYTSPFLRKKDLLKVNKYGCMMTRTFAENYPYSRMYKAEMRGPMDKWLELVEALESGTMNCQEALKYFVFQLKKHSDAFKKLADGVIDDLKLVKDLDLNSIENLIARFCSETDYAARIFEVSMHSFMQALGEMQRLDGQLEQLSQMRSANKKHGNIGDIELTVNNQIVQAWDAKYDKPYLADELNELEDKVQNHSSVEVVGFICNRELVIDNDIKQKMDYIETNYAVEVVLQTFEQWVNNLTSDFTPTDKKELANRWITALVESLAQKRRKVAPIDEPCDRWLTDLDNIMKNVSK